MNPRTRFLRAVIPVLFEHIYKFRTHQVKVASFSILEVACALNCLDWDNLILKFAQYGNHIEPLLNSILLQFAWGLCICLQLLGV